MSWLQELAQTYDRCSSVIGSKNDKIPLLPICHTMQNAQIEITLGSNGNFLSAKVVDKADAPTIIPCAEASSGRTRGQCPHPLHDKLEYLAEDYEERTGGNSDYNAYIKQLDSWAKTSNKNSKLSSILTYLKSGKLISNLLQVHVLYADHNGKLLNEWCGDDPPKIFKLLPGGKDSKGKPKPWQANAFIRFCVEIETSPDSTLEYDAEIWDSWSSYYAELENRKGVCFATSLNTVLAAQHPAKLRHAGDKAKLISANDGSGFTYRGRFLDADQACSISFEVTQKAHSALRWLIGRQGRRFGDQTIVSWATISIEAPDPFKSSLGLFLNPEAAAENDDDGENIEIPQTKKKKEETPHAPVYTAKQFAEKLNNLISGYSAKFDDSESNRVIVIAIDSATPGRMAIRYYRELKGSEFLQRIRHWHESCAWHQYFGQNKQFYGAPSPKDIAEVAYGKKLDSGNKLLGATVSRLLPCILDDARIPRDLVETCVHRASQRIGMDFWFWSKTLGIACALYRKQNNERNYLMEYEENRNTRDYLYGSLLAIAEHIEERALYLAKEKRDTHAAKLMQRFAEHPFSTWRTIELQLTPYLSRLKNNRPSVHQRLNSLWDKTYARFLNGDFTQDTPLSGEFLLGYHTLRKKLWEDAKKTLDTDIQEIELTLTEETES